MNGSAITAIRTAAVSGVATRALARDDAGSWPSSAPASRRARTSTPCPRRARSAGRAWEPPPGARATLAEESAALPARSRRARRRGGPRRGHRRHRDRSAEPVLQREWIADGAHSTRSGRASRARARSMPRRWPRAALRRLARVHPERGGRLPDRGRGGRGRPESHPCGAWRDPDRHATRPHARPARSRSSSRSASPPRTSPRRVPLSRREGAGAGRRRRGDRRGLIPLDAIHAAAPGGCRGSPSARRSCACTADAPARDPQARVPPADRVVQDPRSDQRHGAHGPARASRAAS